MSERRVSQVVNVLDAQREKIRRLHSEYSTEYDAAFDQHGAIASVQRWCDRTTKVIQEQLGHAEATKFGHACSSAPRGRGSWHWRELCQYFDTYLMRLIEDLEENPDDLGDAESSQTATSDEVPTSFILQVINLAEVKLRKVIRSVPTKEREIQDAFENLLIGADIPFSREKDSIEYSSKTYTPDFTVPNANLAIEIKLSTSASHEKEFIAQINDDILAYRTKYRNLLFVVYDCGYIRDKDQFISSFESQGSVVVRVVKH